jgi:hypothetical protein
MPELIPDEIETLRILAGQLPRRLGLSHMICVLELNAIGLCAEEAPHRLTSKGVAALNAVTGTIDLQARRRA